MKNIIWNDIFNNANFIKANLSSPKRKNIHLLDPIIVASFIATTPISQEIDYQKVLNATYSKQIGGIETKGLARKQYFGGN